MTRSHRRWVITNIWKSDNRLNTLGTDIEFTLSFLSAKSLCWWRWILSAFKTQKSWSEDNLNTNELGLSSDVDSAMLWVSHTSVTSTFQVQPLLSKSCFLFTIYAPQSPTSLPKLRFTRVRMREFSQPKALTRTFNHTELIFVHGILWNQSTNECINCDWFTLTFLVKLCWVVIVRPLT